jgi:hypothetical protein
MTHCKSHKSIEPAHQSDAMHHLPHRERHAWHVCFTTGRIVANAQYLARCAEHHFLMGYETRESNAVNTHPAFHGPTRALQRPLLHRRVGKVCASLRADGPGGRDGSARRRVRLLVVVHFDYLGGFHVSRGDLRKVHHQYSANGEIRRPGRPDAAFTRRRVDDVEAFGRKPGRPAHRPHPGSRRGEKDFGRRFSGGEVHQNVSVSQEARELAGVRPAESSHNLQPRLLAETSYHHLAHTAARPGDDYPDHGARICDGGNRC